MSPDFHYRDAMQENSEVKTMKGEMPWKPSSHFSGVRLYISRDDNIVEFQGNIFEPVYGYLGIIHNPNEFPSDTSNYFYFSGYDDTLLEMSPEVVLIEDKLKLWEPDERNCYLPGEKLLTYFKIYTKVNCEHECLSFEILKECNCVPFYMIRK